MARSAASPTDFRLLSSFPAIEAKKLICCSLEGGAWYYVSDGTFAHVDFETGKQTDMKIDDFDQEFADVIDVRTFNEQLLFLGLTVSVWQTPLSNHKDQVEKQLGYFLLHPDIKKNEIIARDMKTLRYFKGNTDCFLTITKLLVAAPPNVKDLITCYAYINSHHTTEDTFQSFILRLAITHDKITLCESVNVEFPPNFSFSNLFTAKKRPTVWYAPHPLGIVQNLLIIRGMITNVDSSYNYYSMDLSKNNSCCSVLTPRLWQTVAKNHLVNSCVVSGDIIVFYEHCSLILLDVERKTEKTLLRINEHRFCTDRDTSICCSRNGMVFLYGKCGDRTCYEKNNFHIYAFDINALRSYFDVSTDATVKFEEKQLVGRGSFGKVIACKLKTSGNIAIKMLKDSTENPHRQHMARMALLEASMLKTIDHQNIVKGLGFIVEKKRILIIMELMEKSVKTKIIEAENHRLSESDTLTVLKHILQGLVHLHTMKPKPIVHRDIKCENILLSKEGIAKICDLGILKTVTISTRGTTVEALEGNAGTIAYIAPEVVKGESHGRKSDVWSMGCAVIEMLTGYSPYRDLLMDLQKRRLSMLWPAEMGKLTYSAEDLIPEASQVIRTTVNEMLTRCTKKQTSSPSSNERIRPYSWELLADVTERFELRPIENLLKEYDSALEVLRAHIREDESLMTNVRRRIEIINGDTQWQDAKGADDFRNILEERSAKIAAELRISIEKLESMKENLRKEAEETKSAILKLRATGRIVATIRDDYSIPILFMNAARPAVSKRSVT